MERQFPCTASSKVAEPQERQVSGRVSVNITGKSVFVDCRRKVINENYLPSDLAVGGKVTGQLS